MIKLINGDCLEVLRTFEDNSIDCVITSPPYYALRDYGTAEWEGGDPSCNHFRDNKITNGCITGHKNFINGVGDAITKNICKKCGAKRIDKQIGIENSFTEYLDKLIEIFAEVKRVLKNDGTCWVNLGDSYNNSGWAGRNKYETQIIDRKNKGSGRCGNSGYQDKCLLNIPNRFAIRMTDELKWILRNEIIWYKPNCMPSSVKDRFTVDFEKIFFFVKNKKYWFEQIIENQGSVCTRKRKSAFRQQNEDNETTFTTIGRNKRCVWDITTKPFKESHFATFPEDLVLPMIKSGCKENGVVLDIFAGAGTTGLVAKKLNRDFIGIELNPEYIEIAKKRIDNYNPLWNIK